MPFFFLIFFPLFFLSKNLFALDLEEAYRKAKSFDPRYLSALYEYKASFSFPSQAMASLLPQASASYTRVSYNFISGPPLYVDYRAEEKEISIRQTLFNLPAILNVKDANLRKRLSELRLKSAEIELIKRVFEAYLDCLYAEESLKVVKEEKNAIEEQKRMTEKLFRAGEATLTDLHDAEARLADVILRMVEAEKVLNVRKRQLETIIGEKPDTLLPFSEEIPFHEPQPASEEEWLTLAKERSPTLLYYRTRVNIAENAFSSVRASRLPTANLIASYSRTEQSNLVKFYEPLSYRYIGFQINLPLLRGGYTAAKEREQKERIEQAEKEYEAALTDITRSISEHFLAMKTSLSAISAASYSLKASEVALESNRKGLKAGIRTVIDVLNAESNLFKAKLNFIKASYDWIKSFVNLRFYAGILSEDDIIRMNGWLKR